MAVQLIPLDQDALLESSIVRLLIVWIYIGLLTHCHVNLYHKVGPFNAFAEDKLNFERALYIY